MPGENVPIPQESAKSADIGLVTTHPLTLPGVSGERRSVPPVLAERYEDIQFLGEGGMGTVYRGRDKRLGRTVALKLIKGQDPQAGQRFLQEARSQAKIDHPHVCRVYEAGEANGEPFIAMQYVEGESLSRLGPKLPLEQRVKIIWQISLAVHEAHRLGLIHRDIKPGNILVERDIDGSYRPYIMDFGLAKEVAQEGKTVTGAVLGTPAFMSPEQAQGDSQAMDRRSDVYALGATLYDLIAGRPPFVADHVWKLLMMVAFEEPPPLSRLKKEVPRDLETIVMKCLERSASRRYDSARDLAEDLKRYLDADPILARRASLGYVVWKKALKYKFLTALLIFSVLAASGLAGVWVKARRDAVVQASIAREFGERVKESELFLRMAYTLPLHDIERDRDVVRGNLSAIEARMREAGTIADGPGHYALGQGYLTLGDLEKAREHLEKAVAAGYRAPEVEYALGKTLGEAYHEALEETRRIMNAAEREKRLHQLHASLRDPALAHLRAASGVHVESPAYVEGLIALYEGRNDEARAKAQTAFEQAPWMYEAKKLEADALYAEGSKYRHDAAFDWDKMNASYEPAAKAYEIASRMGESDPDMHRAECLLWEKKAWAVAELGKNPQSELERAEAACLVAIQASSRDGRAQVQRALTLATQMYTMRQTINGANAISAAEKAVEMRPNDAVAYYALAITNHYELLRSNAALSAESTKVGFSAYNRALEIDPHFTWARNGIGQSYLDIAEFNARLGVDPHPWVEQAAHHFDLVVKLDSSFPRPLRLKVHALTLGAQQDLMRGRTSEDTLRALDQAQEKLWQSTDTQAWRRSYWKVVVEYTHALDDFERGADPGPRLRKAREAIREFAGDSPKEYHFLFELAHTYHLESLYALQEHTDALTPIEAARAAAERAAAVRGKKGDAWRELATEIQITRIRAMMLDNKATAALFSSALDLVQPLIDKDSKNPAPYCLAAEIHALRAVWAKQRPQDVNEDVASGLTLVTKALSLWPTMPTALWTKGLLHHAHGRMMSGPQKIEKEKMANDAFATARHLRPALSRLLLP